MRWFPILVLAATLAGCESSNTGAVDGNDTGTSATTAQAATGGASGSSGSSSSSGSSGSSSGGGTGGTFQGFEAITFQYGEFRPPSQVILQDYAAVSGSGCLSNLTIAGQPRVEIDGTLRDGGALVAGSYVMDDPTAATVVIHYTLSDGGSGHVRDGVLSVGASGASELAGSFENGTYYDDVSGLALGSASGTFAAKTCP